MLKYKFFQPTLLMFLLTLLLSSCASNMSQSDSVHNVAPNNKGQEQVTSKQTIKVKQNNVKRKDNQTPPAIVEQQQYRVAIGDSMYSISKKFGISLLCLSKANNMDDPNKLAAGTLLKIPAKEDCK